MKIFWGLRPSPEKVAERIAVLERELGIDDETVLAEVEQRKMERFNSKCGPILLDPLPKRPLARLHESLDIGPGVKWSIEDATAVQFLTASSYSSNYVQVVSPPKSRVLLPDGVRV